MDAPSVRMISPEAALGRLLWAVLYGACLGLVYDFLRPLRPKLTALADSIFLLCTGALWLHLSFAICRGDLRAGYWAGLALGFFLCRISAGRLLRPVFSAFWTFCRRLFALPTRVVRKIFKEIAVFMKKIFASGKKSGTIG